MSKSTPSNTSWPRWPGYGIDNAIVELDANEPPIADGSSREFCKIIQAAGIAPQAEKRESFTPTEPIELQIGRDDDDAVSRRRLQNHLHQRGQARAGSPSFTARKSRRKTWEKELAHARTFCFFEEIEFLIKNGLIKGGSLENAVVIRDDAVLTTEPLRYPEEFVRHKMLDIVGDLSLLGRPIRGHLIAVKPSHAANCELARQIVAQMQQADARRADVRPAARRKAPRPRPLPSAEGGAMDIERSDEDAAAPLSVSDGGPDHEDRGQQNRRRQKRDDQRAVFSGTFSRAIPSCRACCNWRPWRRSPAS